PVLRAATRAWHTVSRKATGGRGRFFSATSGHVYVSLNTCPSAGIHLNVTRSNSNLTLSWPRLSTSYVLESSKSLDLTNWPGVSESLKTNSGRCQVTVSLDRGQRYFRLRKP